MNLHVDAPGLVLVLHWALGPYTNVLRL